MKIISIDRELNADQNYILLLLLLLLLELTKKLPKKGSIFKQLSIN